MPPPATTPSSIAARVAETASSMRCFFSLSSTSVAAPTLMTATPPASLARRSWSFSRSQSESVFSISALIWLIRPLTSSSVPPPSTMVVLSLVMMTRLAGAEQVERDVLELEADVLADDLGTGEHGHVLQHRLAAVAEAGGLDGGGVERAADLVDDERGERLTLDVLGDDDERLARLHHRSRARAASSGRSRSCPGRAGCRLVEHRFLTLGVGDEVRRQVALVELHALGELELGAERVRLLDRHHAVLADLVDRVGDDLADRRVGGRDGGDVGDVALVVDVLGLRLDRLDGSGDGLLDAALDPPSGWRRRRRSSCRSCTIAWASTVAVVVPSPAMSLVLVATSLTSWAPMFSNGSSSSISLAIDTPSLVIVGAPNFLSSTTLRPFGPSVTLTASASLLTPASSERRAWSSNLRIFAMWCQPFTSRRSRVRHGR